jgi:rhodanese-related sulfurtransferase
VTFFTEPTNLVLIVIALISGALLLWPVVTRRNRGLSAADATQLINRRNAVVIDVRSADDFAKGHLPQARHVKPDELKAKVGQVAKNKNTPVLLVCQTGQHSGKAENVLKEAGYAEVFTLQGGVNAWLQAGMPVVKQGVVK